MNETSIDTSNPIIEIMLSQPYLQIAATSDKSSHDKTDTKTHTQNIIIDLTACWQHH
jgi:hypothetical protein